MIKNQSGVVTTEFIFSLVIAAGLSSLLFAVCYTLAVVEVTQYVVFSTARAHAASHKTPDTQREAGRSKFEQLTRGKSAISQLYAGTWYDIVKPSELDIRSGPTADGKLFEQELNGGASPNDRNWFIGVSARFIAKVMALKIPILGSTSEDDDSGTFTTHINAMLIRESSQKECFDFFEARRNALSKLPSGQSFYQANEYVRMEDNGC